MINVIIGLEYVIFWLIKRHDLVCYWLVKLL